MLTPNAPTIVAWFTEFVVSKQFGPVIVICGTTGSVIGALVCWFIYLLSDLQKDYPLENRIWLSLIVLMFISGLLAMVVIGTGLAHFFLSKERILEFLKSLGPLSFIGFILLQAVQVVAAPVPGEVTGLLGGFLYG
ncbi:MAG TPA: hypothetical protein VN328_09080, partial [Thermodesulfovibrionales bacterium]|nr:hypothetical protein [Thermodesulfovibrionales bacterium]